MILRTLRRLFAVSAVAALALSCGGGGSTPVAPAVVPTPTTAATPTAEVAGPVASSCPLGEGQATATCAKAAPRLGAAVDAAIDRLIAEKPALFNLDEESGEGSRQYKVLDTEAYLDAVVANLRAAGLCAERGLDRQRIVVKSSNEFSEQWDIIGPRNFIRRGGAYQHSCEPAAFPVDPADLMSFIWTGIFALECNPGIVPPATQEKKIPLGCDAYITATPKMLNWSDVPDWIHGRDVTWFVRDGAHLISVEDDWRYGNEFNRLIRPKGVGYFSICASLYGKKGCLNADIVP